MLDETPCVALSASQWWTPPEGDSYLSWLYAVMRLRRLAEAARRHRMEFV